MGWFGTNSSSKDNGDTHTTDWDSSGIRYSKDTDSSGNSTGRHIVDSTDGEKCDLPDCRDSDDEMSRDR